MSVQQLLRFNKMVCLLITTRSKRGPFERLNHQCDTFVMCEIYVLQPKQFKRIPINTSMIEEIIEEDRIDFSTNLTIQEERAPLHYYKFVRNVVIHPICVSFRYF